MLRAHPSFDRSSTGRPLKVCFILTPDYALMSIAAAVEPLRAANHLAGRMLYDCRFFTTEGGYLASSAAGGFMCEPLAALDRPDLLIVVAGGNPMRYEDPALIACLRHHAAHGVRLGGISGGPVILARHGLMKARRFTLHWAHIEPLRAVNEDLLIEPAVFIIDRDRLSCAGGVAALDMMAAIIAADHGVAFAKDVAQWFIHARLRDTDEPQQARHVETNPHYPAAVKAAISLMEQHIADPLNQEQLARLTGMSSRQLQRLFQSYTSHKMMEFYREMRLEKSKALISQSNSSLTEIALMCGFNSLAAFSRAYKDRYGKVASKAR